MKKIFSVLMVLAMLCAPMAISVSAAADYEISMNSVEATHGDEVVIEVSLDTNPGIWGCIFTIVYDPAYFDLVSVDNGEIFPSATIDEPDDSGSHIYFGEAKGITNLKGNPTGVVAKYTFKVLKTAPAGVHTIDVYLPDNGNGWFIDANDMEKDVTVELTKKGSITVTGTPETSVDTETGATDTETEKPAETDADTFVPPPTVWPDYSVDTEAEGTAEETTATPVQTTPVTDENGSTVEETTSLGEPLTPEETETDKEYVTEYETDAEGEFVLDIDGKPKTVYREVIRGGNDGGVNPIVYVIAGVCVVIAVAVVASVIVVRKKKTK